MWQFTGFKKLYESDKKPPVFCAACELGGCVVLLGKFLSLSSTIVKENTLYHYSSSFVMCTYLPSINS